MKFSFFNETFLNKVGSFGSFVCLLHCVMLTFLPGITALLGLRFLLKSNLEWTLSLFTILIAGFSAWLAWKNHGSKKIALLFLLGSVGLFSSRLLEGRHGHDLARDQASHAPATESSSKPANYDGKWGLHYLASLFGILSGTAIFIGHRKSVILLARCHDNS